MSFSLITVVVAFTALVVWVYWPGNKARFEARGRIPLDEKNELSTTSKESSNDE
jgi:cbb3-type cytochrome oxidase subunit 3